MEVIVLLVTRFTVTFVLDLTWRKTRTVCWKEEYFIKYHLIVALTLRLYQVSNIFCYNATFILWCPSVSLTISDSNIRLKSVAFLHLDRSVRPSGLDFLFTFGRHVGIVLSFAILIYYEQLATSETVYQHYNQ